MKHKLLYLFSSWIAWILTFALGKVGFMLYNRAENPFSAGDVFDVVRHGLSQDMSTAGYLVALPWLVILVSLVRDGRWVQRVLAEYLCLASFIVGIALCIDSFLYEFWKFKLNATVFAYADDLQGTTNSVSLWYLLSRLATTILVALLIAAVQLRLLYLLYIRRSSMSVLDGASITKDHTSGTKAPLRARILHSSSFIVHLLVGALLFVVIRGGVSTAVQNVGTAYYSQRLYLNHSAVNPLFSLMSSVRRTADFAAQFRFYDEAACQAVVAHCYPATDAPPSDTLLTTDRPDILIVLMEGFGGKFVEALGGIPRVAPHLNALVHEGVFFDHYYSNSFRTDRGTVSLLSGWVSYPTESLMKLPARAGRLPGLARSLAEAGYTTEYVYGGDIDFTGTRGYLVTGGFQRIVSDGDFPLAEARGSKWGVCDGLTAERVAQMLTAPPTSAAPSPRLLTYQTLSSHEPFEVPYSRLPDARLNAFAYTDDCIGHLIATLRLSPVWDNLLVILVPDHGFLFDLTYEDPDYFHCPMLWLGGAVRAPRRVPVLMNQSDLCATLLGQLRLPHDAYPWSRDVLSPQYVYPCVYSTSASTVMFGDSTGVTIYDLESDSPITERPRPSSARLCRVKALLQHSYTRLGEGVP